MKNTKAKSPMYDRLLERYLKGYITDAQLDRYVTLGQLTVDEADEFRVQKQWQDHPESKPEVLPE